MTLEQWIDRGFWALICVVALYVGGQMKEISDSVNQLNTKLTVYITKSDSQAQVIVDHEGRIRTLEGSMRKH